MTDVAGIGRILLVAAPAAVVAALLSSALIMVLTPWLKAHALVVPNPRSSHREPTPQGGGAAVVAATFAVAWSAAAVAGSFANAGETSQFLAVTAAATLLAVVGAVDDIRGLSPVPRLVLQFAAVSIVIAALPGELNVVPMLPWWIERACLLVAGVWFVNVVNFMDGIDWMTVAEAVPITGAIVLLGLCGVVSPLPMFAALALLGAIVGFAPFNKPVARLFLGDVGSQPIGLVLAWLLLLLAARGHVAAALLLSLYSVADATLTLIRRMLAGEPFWQPHRTHFYQRAGDGGFTAVEIVTRVFLVNLALAALALVTITNPSGIVCWASLALGAALVGWQLMRFAQGK